MQTIAGRVFCALPREGGIPEEDAHLKTYDLTFRFPSLYALFPSALKWKWWQNEYSNVVCLERRDTLHDLLPHGMAGLIVYHLALEINSRQL